MNALWSVFFWAFAFVWMGLLAFLTIVLLPFFHYRRIHHWIPRPGFEVLARLAVLGRFQVTYDPAFDPKRFSVFLMNHTNLLDAHTASTVISTPFCGLMNGWHFSVPFYGWLMKHSRGIPVRAEDRGRTLERLTEEAALRLQEGMSILAFPEAHRTTDGTIRRFRKGVFFMARDAGYPVVPVAVRGMFAVNRKGSWRFRPGPVSVHVGPQFETRGLSDRELERLSDRIREILVAHVERGEVEPVKEVVNA